MINIGGVVTNDQKLIKELEAEEKAYYSKKIKQVDEHLDNLIKPMFQREPIPANEKAKFLQVSGRSITIISWYLYKLPDQPESEKNRPVLEKLRTKYNNAIEVIKAQKESLRIDIE